MMQDFFNWREQARSYSALAAYGSQQAAIGTEEGVSQVTSVYTLGDFWSITGAQAERGYLSGEAEA